MQAQRSRSCAFPWRDSKVSSSARLLLKPVSNSHCGAQAPSQSQHRISTCRHGFAFSRPNSPELCFVAHPLEPRGRREDRVLTSHPRSAARRCSAKRPHSSIQVVPITRPSLRDGRTAYAVLSREPSSFWPPSLLRNSPASRRLTRLPPPQELDRSNDGQDHTVLPYARPAISPAVFPALSTELETYRRDEA
ncbi:hypothetical protein ACVIU7_003835 [Bradyrhizobium liaoningense]